MTQGIITTLLQKGSSPMGIGGNTLALIFYQRDALPPTLLHIAPYLSPRHLLYLLYFAVFLVSKATSGMAKYDEDAGVYQLSCRACMTDDNNHHEGF